MTKNYLSFDFASFKESLMTAFNEWDYSEKDAGKYAAECICEDLDGEYDFFSLYDTLRTVAHDIFNGSRMIDLKINADDVTDYEIIYGESKEFYRSVETRDNGEETLYIWDTSFFSESLDEVQEYADQNKPSLGYFWKIEKLITNQYDPNLELCEQDYDDIELVIESSVNEGRNVLGALVVTWSHQKYVGYSQRVKELFIYDQNLNESDLMTDNEKSVYKYNNTIILYPEERELDKHEVILLATQRLSDGWKWCNPISEEEIIKVLGLEF